MTQVGTWRNLKVQFKVRNDLGVTCMDKAPVPADLNLLSDLHRAEDVVTQ